MIAVGLVAADGSFASQSGFVSVSHVSTGRYALTLSNPPADITDVVPVGMVANTTGSQIAFANISSSVFDVYTFDGSGAAADMPFSIAVYGLA